jgi:hypothetical protein
MLAMAVAALSRCGGQEPIDLIARFGEAQKSPDASVFTLTEATLAGGKNRAIAIAPVDASRLGWHLQVPRGAWLWVSIGLQPEAWTKEGDGVTFTASVSSAGTTTALAEQRIEPFADSGDRKWFPIRVSLSDYAGKEVDLVLTTTASAAGHPADQRNDLALWGAPEIVVR